MKYYKLSIDMTRENDVIFHCLNDYGVKQNDLIKGELFEDKEICFQFYYDEKEGDIWTDFIANDKGWFIVSDRVRILLENCNSDIQFLDTVITKKNGEREEKKYFITNVVKVVDALCLDKSDYFETNIKGIGVIYTVSKYGIYRDRTDNADIFKLGNRQQIPTFISERLKDMFEKNEVTGIVFAEINVE